MDSNKKRAFEILSTAMIFGVIGGFIGGFFLGVVFVIESSATSIHDFFKVPFLFAFLGILFGFLPAFITGAWASARNLSRKKQHYVEMFIAGSLFSVFYLFCWVVVDVTFLAVLLFIFLGGFSAMIVGRLVLSKE